VLHVSCSIRTLIRSFEREVYVIPNAVFSKNAVLNVTRKSKEFRFYEYLCVRVQDVHKVNTIIQVCNPLAPTPPPPDAHHMIATLLPCMPTLPRWMQACSGPPISPVVDMVALATGGTHCPDGWAVLSMACQLMFVCGEGGRTHTCVHAYLQELGQEVILFP
jgi:hypothetical protein